MICQPYSQLIAVKRWADRGLYDVVGRNFDRLTNEEASIVLRILDHMHVVDRIFQHHLQGLSHGFKAPRSDELPQFQTMASSVRELDDWYVAYVGNLRPSDFDQPVDLVFTNGTPARMRRGEQKNGITPHDDRMTDFLAAAAETDRYWNAIVNNGGTESACGWCKDRWGLSWQITPRTLLEATTDSNRAAAKRAFEAMMKMKKIDIAAIEAARRGTTRAQSAR